MPSISTTGATSSSITVLATASGDVPMIYEFYIDNVVSKGYSVPKGVTSQSHTYTGLEPDRGYNLKVIWYNSETSETLDVRQIYDRTTASSGTPDPPGPVDPPTPPGPSDQTYYGRIVLYKNDGSGGSGVPQPVASATSSGSSAYVQAEYDASGFTRKGYILLGVSHWADQSDAAIGPSGTYEIEASSTSSSAPTEYDMYAIWKKNIIAKFYWSVPIVQGNTVNITAAEWNRFIKTVVDYINGVGDEISPTDTAIVGATATSGTVMKASQASSALLLLKRCGGITQDVIDQIGLAEGTPITAEFFNYTLQERFNTVVDKWNNSQ